MWMTLTRTLDAPPAAVWPHLMLPARMNAWSLAEISLDDPGEGGRGDAVGTVRSVRVRSGPTTSVLREVIALCGAAGFDLVLVETAGIGQSDSEIADLAEVRGQHQARRALEVAAGGGHNLLFVGPPGSGKTLLARSLPSILPSLTQDEALEITKIYSVCGLLPSNTPLMRHRPFRAPHYTISQAGLVGGGRLPRPGEITLSHLGVLFLDELPEFVQADLEVLRQPLEDKTVTIDRKSTRLNSSH